MTIDEAIVHAREVASRKFDDRVHCIRCAEEHEQLAEWLEELKILKSLKNCSFITIGKTVEQFEQEIRNKAIDDFAEKLNAKCDGMINDTWNSNVAPISWAEAYANFKDDIDDVAEQLKRGDGE